MGFQWDEAKSKANEAKHGLSFLQAAQIFRGFVVLTVDQRREYGEIGSGRWACMMVKSCASS
jgi:uncharacterized DUF497 family protein